MICWISNGHISAARYPIHFMFPSRQGFRGRWINSAIVCSIKPTQANGHDKSRALRICQITFPNCYIYGFGYFTPEMNNVKTSCNVTKSKSLFLFIDAAACYIRLHGWAQPWRRDCLPVRSWDLRASMRSKLMGFNNWMWHRPVGVKEDFIRTLWMQAPVWPATTSTLTRFDHQWINQTRQLPTGIEER